MTDISLSSRVTEEDLATCEEQPEVFTLECGSSLLLSSWNQLPPSRSSALQAEVQREKQE